MFVTYKLAKYRWIDLYESILKYNKNSHAITFQFSPCNLSIIWVLSSGSDTPTPTPFPHDLYIARLLPTISIHLEYVYTIICEYIPPPLLPYALTIKFKCLYHQIDKDLDRNIYLILIWVCYLCRIALSPLFLNLNVHAIFYLVDAAAIQIK